MSNDDLRAAQPNMEMVQCRDCKHRAFMEWEGKLLDLAAAANCKKYPKEKGVKPAGILFRKYDVSKHERECDGVYVPCKFYEPEE